MALNFPREVIIQRILPHFEFERLRFNYGSPYRRGPKTRGRRLHISSIDLLGMVLWYIKTSGTQYELCPNFGLVPSSVGVWLDYAMEVLIRTVKKRDRKDFEVRWPSPEEMHASAELLRRNRGNGFLLNGVFAVVDGGRMPCADYINRDLQNAYYEGYTQKVEVTNLFVWNFFGEIIHAAVNYPGSWHDSKLASASGLIYPKLSDAMTPPGFAILGDSAFTNDTRLTKGKVIRGRKTNELQGIPNSIELAAVDTILQRIMPSERQSAEWGVRAIKGPFARLKRPLSPDSLKRERLLRICTHLFNLRTRHVGLNQIRSVYANTNEKLDPWLKPFLQG